MAVPAANRKRWAVLAVVIAADAMDLIDSTIVNVAGPSVRDSLHAPAYMAAGAAS